MIKSASSVQVWARIVTCHVQRLQNAPRSCFGCILFVDKRGSRFSIFHPYRTSGVQFDPVIPYTEGLAFPWHHVVMHVFNYFMPNHCRLLPHTYRIQSHHWVDVLLTVYSHESHYIWLLVVESHMACQYLVVIAVLGLPRLVVRHKLGLAARWANPILPTKAWDARDMLVLDSSVVSHRRNSLIKNHNNRVCEPSEPSLFSY